MNYQEQIKNAVQKLYEATKRCATSRHYTFGYGWVRNVVDIDLNNKKIRDDVWEMSYSNEFCDLIQTLDFDDDNKEVTVMLWASNNKKKYTLKDWKKFCDEALIIPPFEDEENWQKWIDEHKIQIIVNGCEIELDYNADTINEIEFSLREIHNAILGDGTATTGNTVGSEYRDATWKDILRFAVLYQLYENKCKDYKEAIWNCIYKFSPTFYKEIMREIDEQTSYNDELEVNFFKLDTTDLWKIFDEEERRQAFKEILCSKIEIEELVDENGDHGDKVVITDYSIRPSGDLVGWHYGVEWDKNHEDNQWYVRKYIEEMTK